MSTTTPDQQLSLTEAFDRAPVHEEPTIYDDRVVGSVEPCRECESRPAGADGLCPPCRQTQWGGQMNGRRL